MYLWQEAFGICDMRGVCDDNQRNIASIAVSDCRKR